MCVYLWGWAYVAWAASNIGHLFGVRLLFVLVCSTNYFTTFSAENVIRNVLVLVCLSTAEVVSSSVETDQAATLIRDIPLTHHAHATLFYCAARDEPDAAWFWFEASPDEHLDRLRIVCAYEVFVQVPCDLYRAVTPNEVNPMIRRYDVSVSVARKPRALGTRRRLFSRTASTEFPANDRRSTPSKRLAACPYSHRTPLCKNRTALPCTRTNESHGVQRSLFRLTLTTTQPSTFTHPSSTTAQRDCRRATS